MRDRALIVTELPAKSFILNRIAGEDDREGRHRVEEGFGEGKGWEVGVRATGSSINSREMQASLADSPLVFSSAFERSLDGLTGPFLTSFPLVHPCLSTFSSLHRGMEEGGNSLWTRNGKGYSDTRVRKGSTDIPKYFHPLLLLFVSRFRGWCIHYPGYV